MADLNCKACEDLREEVPELIANGFDDAMCASLQNDTGLKASSGHNDCTDLNNLNDCLIGNLEDEVERYDNCDWKTFTKMFANNAWTTLKAIICSICGIWTNIHNLWSTIRSFCITKTGNTISLTSNLGTHCSVTDSDTKYDLSISGHTISLTGSDGSTDSVTVPDNDTWQPNTKTQDGYVTQGQGYPNMVWKTDADGNPAWREEDAADVQCIIDYLSQGDSFSFGENTQEGKSSKLVPGKGVDFTLRSSSDDHSNDVRILYIAGGLARFGGSLRLFTSSFYDKDGDQRNGNTNWNFSSSSSSMPRGGELLFTVRIKKSEYPQIKRLYNGCLFPTGGNDKFFQVFAICFDSDYGEKSSDGHVYAYGQHGWCNKEGEPQQDGYSSGVAVPEGWMYLQARMLYKGSLTSYDVKDGRGNDIKGADLTPQGYIGIRIDSGEIDCD